ncbi:hypothetical protein L3X38_009588 [Prunus dulcis]|uniref:Uncharacterized protein n=1 Tax=Prunus dulcis TaxID=3755 RepID=A0AAD4WEV3_PRUDU|nr:hypothetical protein L3X38_009588 [Prunus dulcis]
MEALQVLSMRMICEEDGSFPEKAEFEDDFIAEDLEAESRIVQLFKDSVENLAVISWSPNQSPWSRMLECNPAAAFLEAEVTKLYYYHLCLFHF